MISLVEEQIPHYTLRADTLTQFGGYDNEDWIHTPLVPHDAANNLSTEVIEETLKYFSMYI